MYKFCGQILFLRNSININGSLGYFLHHAFQPEYGHEQADAGRDG